MKIFLMTLFIALAQQNCNSGGDLNFVKATSQAWSGGAAGSGHGTNYTIYFTIKDTTGIRFDSLWVNQKRLKTEMKFTHDTLIVFASDFVKGIFPGGENQPLEIVPVNPPVTSNAAGVLRAWVENSPVNLSIPNFERLPALAYP